MRRGGYVACTLNLDEDAIKRDLKMSRINYDYLGRVTISRKVLLIDNNLCKRSVKNMFDTEVHIGHCSSVNEFNKFYKNEEFDAINIEGDVSPKVEALLMGLIRRKE